MKMPLIKPGEHFVWENVRKERIPYHISLKERRYGISDIILLIRSKKEVQAFKIRYRSSDTVYQNKNYLFSSYCFSCSIISGRSLMIAAIDL